MYRVTRSRFLLIGALLTGSVTAQPLDGVYMGLRQSGITGALYQDYWTFFPDGLVMDDYPTEGLDRPIDTDQGCKTFICGTYVQQGSTLLIHWQGDSEATVYDLDENGALQQRGKVQKYRPLLPLDGLRLDATYAVNDVENGTTIVEVRLTQEGRFAEKNLMRYTSWDLLGQVGETRVALPGGQGTYTIHRNTLTLHYDGGPTAYFFVVVPPGAANTPVPSVLYINTASLDRRVSTATSPAQPARADLSLSVPAPNPASGTAKLTLALSAPQPVRVEVLDALGRRVVLLHDGVLGAGLHLLTLDAAALPAGLYHVRAIGSGANASQTVIVAH